MYEISPSFNDSFNEEFCVTLEYHLCETFNNHHESKFDVMWCDGVSWVPFFNPEANRDYLSYIKVKERGYIETSSQIGTDGQGRYTMIIILGEKSLEKYKTGSSIIDCIPGSDTMDWLELDEENMRIEIRLK